MYVLLEALMRQMPAPPEKSTSVGGVASGASLQTKEELVGKVSTE